MTTYYSRMRGNTAHASEVPFARATARKNVARKMDRSNWALAFTGAVLALVDYVDNASYKWERACKVLEVQGRYARVIRLTEMGEWGAAHWINTTGWYRACDTVREYRLERTVIMLQKTAENATYVAERGTADKLSLLSQNTVTRALVHAYQNDYCSETAVALISAGHKMPDVTLDFEVTVSVSVTLDGNENYYPLRELFGSTGGEVEGASHNSHIERHDKVRELIEEQISSGELDIYGGITHTGTSVDWGTPVLRQVSSGSISVN